MNVLVEKSGIDIILNRDKNSIATLYMAEDGGALGHVLFQGLVRPHYDVLYLAVQDIYQHFY